MRKTFLLFACIALIAVLPSCKGRGTSTQGAATATIAPQAPPATASDTASDTALTQTIDIEDSRSEAEGGTSTATAVQKKTGAAASSRKAPTSPSRPPGRTQ